MSDVLQKLGIRKDRGSFPQTLFYFIREFKINPFDEEFLVYDKNGNFNGKLVKKGIPLSLFESLIKEMNEHYKREEAEMKKARRR